MDYSAIASLAERLNQSNDGEEMYQFFVFNALLHRQLQAKGEDKVETCSRICEYLDEKKVQDAGRLQKAVGRLLHIQAIDAKSTKNVG